MSIDAALTLLIMLGAMGLIVRANQRLGKTRADGRSNQVPWGLVMFAAAFVVFVGLVHLLNLGGVETGPEHSLFGRGVG